MLLEGGLDVFEKNEEGFTAVELAAENCDRPIFSENGEFLEEYQSE